MMVEAGTGPDELVGQMIYFPVPKVIGKVKKVWDGEAEAYQREGSPPVKERVLELEDGNALLGRKGAYVRLSDDEVSFYYFVQDRTAKFVQWAMHPAATLGMPMGTAMLLMEAALGEASRVVRMAGAKVKS